MIKFFSKDTGSTTRRLLALLAHTLFNLYFICIVLLGKHFEFKMQFRYMEINSLCYAMLMRNCAQKD